jgi:hypothetical protein
MTAMVTSRDQFKSNYKSTVFLVPVITSNSSNPSVAAKEIIKLEVSGNKTLPGFEDGEEWTFSTDNPEQEIAEKIVGKFGGIAALVYEVPYDPMLLELLVAHKDTNFTVRIIYDDTQYSEIYKIDVLKCFLKNPGSAPSGANNSAPTMTITLQPRGGGLLSECLDISSTARA